MSAFLTWRLEALPFIELSMGFDAVQSETHELSGEVTSHPVEKGIDITDNVYVEPETVTLEVMVTNTPINENSLFGIPLGVAGAPLFLDVPAYEPPFAPTPGAVFSAIGGAVRSQLGQKREFVATVLRFGRTDNHISTAQEQFWSFINDRVLVDVHTKSRTFSNMLLVRAPMTRRPDLGDAAVFSLEFKNLRIVESSFVSVPKETVAKKKVDKGQKSPKETEKTSVALDLAGGASSVVNWLKRMTQ